jgi:Flp pilus assembly protein TadB
MSAQYTPVARGFGPRFRGPASDQHLRVSDAERQAVADRLAEHYGAGRLDNAEFDERAGRAMSAKTRGDLVGLLDDLPGTAAPAARGTPVTRGRPRRARTLLFVLLVLLALAAVHAALHALVLVLWVGLVAAALIVVTRGRTRRDQ